MPITQENTSQTSTWYTPRRNTTQRRHQIVIDTFNELSKIRVKGMRPHVDDVLEMVSRKTGYAKGTVENIIGRRLLSN